jgi:hypothetical protein
MHKYRQIKILGKGGFGCALLVSSKDNPKDLFVVKEVRASQTCSFQRGCSLDDVRDVNQHTKAQ